MGTTLTNGIYLPNEGEKNCYAGLKTNWETLDQKIADITALQQAVAGALHREIVASLPTTDIDPNTIYMILSGTSATENVYDEFMYVNNAWELIGTSATDLTNYYTKGDVDGLLLLKANASDLTSHTGDTTIHVTASDKSKWNTVALIKQLRLVNAQVGSATTIAFANIDDTNGIKVGDKCMDLDAKMFEITAVDTANQTVTVGSALIDLALDANVVHTSGNETISGDKVFNNRLIKNIDVVLGTAPSTGKFSNIDIADNNKSSLLQVLGGVYDTGNSYARFFIQNKTADDGSGLSPTGTLRGCGFNINLPASSTSEGQGSITPRANKTTDFGLLGYQWRNLWCEKLFLNGTQLDPSAFALDANVVHTSGDETINGVKSFINYFLGKDLSGQTVDLNDCVDAYGGAIHYYYAVSNYTNISNKPENKPFILESKTVRYVSSIDYIYYQKIYTADYNTPPSIYTRYYRSGSASWSNWVKDTDKYVTTNTNQTISGQKTFSEDMVINNSDTSQTTKRLVITSSKVNLGDSNSDSWGISFNAGSSYVATINSEKSINSVQGLNFTVRTKDGNNNLISTSYRLRVYTDGSAYLIPSTTDSISLGSSSNKWKDVQTNLVNGLAPSSLGMPVIDRTKYVDISGYFTNTGNGDINTYSVTANGWIYLRLTDIGGCQLSVLDSSNNRLYGSTSSGNLEQLCLPVTAGTVVETQWTTSTSVTVTNAYFVPCLGNI